MYQEAIRQNARELGVKDHYEPNPEMERIDASLRRLSTTACFATDPIFDFDFDESLPLIPKEDTREDVEFNNRNNALTFFTMKELEQLFESYQPYQPNPNRVVRRSYHSGRIYGNGQYGDPERERDFQAFIRNANLVFRTQMLAPTVKREVTEFDALIY